MAIVIPLKSIVIHGFSDFCLMFDIETKNIAGENGSDEELILEELSKIPNKNWLLNFIDNRKNGYFLLQQLQ